jgi:hypothetical protein
MNSLGAYVASAATVRVPFDLIALGTWEASEPGEPDAVGVALVAAVVPAVALAQPAASSAMIEIAAVANSGRRTFRGFTWFPLTAAPWRHCKDAGGAPCAATAQRTAVSGLLTDLYRTIALRMRPGCRLYAAGSLRPSLTPSAGDHSAS